MTQLRLGYSPFYAPNDGIGPFRALFQAQTNLAYVDSLKGIDAILLWGGEDISPSLYAETPIPCAGPAQPSDRDLFELELCRQAHQEGKPIIGVCRGSQFVCAFAGGKLVQDVTGHGSSSGHEISTLDFKNFTVTSSHHQMMYPYNTAHTMLAWSTQKRSAHYRGLSKNEEEVLVDEPEVVYFPEVNGFAVQCHPEWHNNVHLFNPWMIDRIQEYCFGD